MADSLTVSTKRVLPAQPPVPPTPELDSNGVPVVNMTGAQHNTLPKSPEDVARLSDMQAQGPIGPQPAPQTQDIPTNTPAAALPPPDLNVGQVPNAMPPPELFGEMDNPVAPQRKVGMGEKLAHFLPLAGAIGGALEAAGHPMQAPEGAQMLQRSMEAAANRNLEREKMQKVDIPVAQAHAQYFSSFNPTKVQVQQEKNQGTLENTTLKNYGALQVAALKSGAPMLIDPQMAALAGQPQMAGQMASGPTLQNFIRALGARGIGIHDLGDEGLWAIDKFGNRVKQITVHSPMLDRAREYAKSRAEWTPFGPVFNTDGTIRTISNAQAITEGIPKAVLPTAAARSRGEQAQTIEIVGRGLINEIQQNADELGPLMGRYQSLADWIGDPDPRYKGLKGALESWIALHPAAHGFRGLNAVREFQKAFGNTFNTPESLMAGIQGSFGTMQGLQQTAQITPGAYPQNPATKANVKSSKAGGAQKTIPVFGNDGKQIGTATPEQQKRGTYTPTNR